MVFMLKEIAPLLLLLSPFLFGTLASWGIHRFPSRYYLLLETVVALIILVPFWLLWHSAEDGWGPVLMVWPLSAVLVFICLRLIYRKRYPHE